MKLNQHNRIYSHKGAFFKVKETTDNCTIFQKVKNVILVIFRRVEPGVYEK